MPTPNDKKTSPVPHDKNLDENITLVERIVVEKNYSIRTTSDMIKALFLQMQHTIIPESSIRAASILIRKWGNDLLDDNKKRWDILITNVLNLRTYAEKLNEKIERDAAPVLSTAGELKAYLAQNNNPDPEVIEALVKRIQILQTPEIKEDDIPKLTGLEQVFDDSAMKELIKKVPQVAGLEQFISDADASLRLAGRRFNLFGVALNIINFIVIALGFILSYYIGEWLENPFRPLFQAVFKFEPTHIQITFAALIICALTADRWKEEAKAVVFWQYAQKVTAKNRKTADDFFRLQQQFMTAAGELLQKASRENYSAKLADTRSTLNADPHNIKAYRERVVIKQGMDDKEGAKQDIEFLDIMVKSLLFARDAITQGITCINQQENEKAIDYFTYAISFGILPDTAYYYRGMAKKQLGDNSGALKDLDMTIQLKPLATAYSFRGGLHVLLENYAEAVKDFEHALELDPVNKETLKILEVVRGLSQLQNK